MASQYSEDFDVDQYFDSYKNQRVVNNDDVELLKTGMILGKLDKSGTFKDRHYRLDLVNYRLVASSNSIMTEEKYYSLFEINTVKKGACIADLKHHNIKKVLKYENAESEMETRGFLLFHEKSSKALYLLAPTEYERDKWCNVLDHFLYLCKKRKCVLPNTAEVIKDYFQMADKSKDGKLSYSEIERFLKTLNLKLSKKELKAMIRDIDANDDGHVDEDEFLEFMSRISRRPGIIALFNNLTDNHSDKTQDTYLPLEIFRYFLSVTQREVKSVEQCRELIRKYEPEPCKDEDKFSLAGFSLYLNDPLQHIVNPFVYEKVYQDMNQPLQNYYIHSSHNTYLSGDQLQSKSKVGCYISALTRGCRLLELDCQEGPNGPLIYHNYTLTSKLEFEDVIKAVKEFAFKTSDYPVILGLEIHCPPAQRRQMAECIVKHLGEFLYNGNVDEMTQLPSLNELKRKIFIRAKKLPQSEIIKNPDLAPLDNLLNLFQSVGFRGFEKTCEENKPYQGVSLSESEAKEIIEKHSTDTMRLTNKIIVKVYPAGLRFDSSNADPIDYWNYGYQIVALNLQTRDKARLVNEALFNDNGQCGYVLKPEILRDLKLGFDPNNTLTMRNGKLFQIRIISAQNLPAEFTSVGTVRDILDPYVVIKTFGVAEDCLEAKTTTVDDNGFNPVWNEDFHFTINCPELAFVNFTVKDKDLIGSNDFIGEFTIRFTNMREGYRHIKLKNKAHKGTLFVRIELNDLQR